MRARQFAFFLSTCGLLLFLTACSKCTGSNSASGQGNKRDYIAALDNECTAASAKTNPIAQEMKALPKEDTMGRVNAMERLKAIRTETAAAIEKIAPQPTEDSQTLAQFWEEYRKQGELFSQQTEALKAASEAMDESAAAGPDETLDEELKQAVANFKQKAADLVAQSQKLAEVARKYGFQVCGADQR